MMADVLGDRDIAGRDWRLARISCRVEGHLAQQPRDLVKLPGIHITYDTSQVIDKRSWKEDVRMPRDRDVQAFDDRAASYESGRHGQLHKEISDRAVRLALSQVPAPRRVLDVGCGTGYVLRQLAARLPGASEFLGVDPAPKMIEAARAASSDERLNFTQGIAERLPADESVYDLVVSTTSFDHWTDQAAGIRECARALAPGGTLVLTDQFSSLLWPTMLGSRRGKARTRSRAGRLITAAGLRDPQWHPCYAVIIRSVTAVK